MKGRPVAKTCHQELAELYEERLGAKGLAPYLYSLPARL